MILPIFISVSLAPGSYFFCALAAVKVIAATTAKAVRPIKLLVRAGIVSLPLGSFSFAQVSQVARGHASAGLFRGAKQHCCGSPIMIDAGRAVSFHQGDRLPVKRRICSRAHAV